jgi:hypothetical protein
MKFGEKYVRTLKTVEVVNGYKYRNFEEHLYRLKC